MRETSQTNRYNRQTAKRLTAFALLLCFLAVALFAEALILAHTDHEHDYNGVNGSCAACAQLQSAARLLKQLGAVTGGVPFAFAAIFAVAATLKSVALFAGFPTLTGLKVRMNH